MNNIVIGYVTIVRFSFDIGGGDRREHGSTKYGPFEVCSEFWKQGEAADWLRSKGFVRIPGEGRWVAPTENDVIVTSEYGVRRYYHVAEIDVFRLDLYSPDRY